MKKNALWMIIGAVFVVSLMGCMSKQPLSIPQEGNYQNKLTRFYYMQDNWSYLNNDWITGQKVTSGMLQKNYDIGSKVAVDEVKEFKRIQWHYSGFQRFLESIYIINVRYYINY
jgi:hypothetical protein